jgi:hypothetical protein
MQPKATKSNRERPKATENDRERPKATENDQKQPRTTKSNRKNENTTIQTSTTQQHNNTTTQQHNNTITAIQTPQQDETADQRVNPTGKSVRRRFLKGLPVCTEPVNIFIVAITAEPHHGDHPIPS